MGEATLAELWDDFCGKKDFEDSHLVPAKKGVYCIRIPAGMEVTFKDTIDNHPGAAYPIERLEAKRVPATDILYIGKANGKRAVPASAAIYALRLQRRKQPLWRTGNFSS